MAALSRIANDQNAWLNEHGGPIRKSTFIKEWHELDNDFWLAVFTDAVEIDSTTKYPMPQRLKQNIVRCVEHINQHGNWHNNILNPTVEDTAGLPKFATHISRDISIKSVFWQTMMQLREYYNLANAIPINNTPEDRGKLRSTRDTFGELFEWR